jgi:two-component system, chemotaxis family, response regulator PixH
VAVLLIVDDDRNMLRAFRAVFEAEGFRVLSAHDGKTALSIALADHPDVVLTDYMMPGFNGLELSRRLRSMLATASIPIVILTATFPPPPMAAELSNMLLTKPVSIRELIAVVRSLLPEGPVHRPPPDSPGER